MNCDYSLFEGMKNQRLSRDGAKPRQDNHRKRPISGPCGRRPIPSQRRPVCTDVRISWPELLFKSISQPPICRPARCTTQILPPRRRHSEPGPSGALPPCGSVCRPAFQLICWHPVLIDQGMNWSQAVLTVFLGNVIVLMPMILNSNAYAGTKYGIPFPVYCRASFWHMGSQHSRACCVHWSPADGSESKLTSAAKQSSAFLASSFHR